MYEIVIKEDGSVVKRTLSEVPINILDSIEEKYQKEARFKIPRLIDFGKLVDPFYGFGGLICDTSEGVYWSVNIITLNLNTSFVVNDGVLTPSFWPDSEGSSDMEIPWRKPDDMKLVLGFIMHRKEAGYLLGKHYLCAFDGANRLYRLPLANLYETCELCHGQDLNKHPTAMDAAIVALKAFRSSRWNSDLYGSFQKTCAPSMFRFKVINEGFEQLPISGDWIQLCEKVGNDFIMRRFLT